MKFIKTYLITLVLSYVFVFFGGWMLFDFRNHYFLAIAACAFIIAIVISLFCAQEEKIEQLQKRIEKLESAMIVIDSKTGKYEKIEV